MSSLDEPAEPDGGDRTAGAPVEQWSRSALEARVRELERENAQLKSDLAALNVHVARDAELFHALAVQGIPADQREMREHHATSASLRDLLAELERGT